MASSKTKTPKKTLRSSSDIYLIGVTEDRILGSKLPTKKQVLQVFFHYLRVDKLSVKESATIAFDQAIEFWERARIPTTNKQHGVQKLINLHIEWKNIKKGASRRTGTQEKNEKEFENKIAKLFDIASVDALETMKIQEDKDFLILQREQHRGTMAGLDKKLTTKEKKKSIREEQEQQRQQKHEEQKQCLEAGKYLFTCHRCKCASCNY